MYTEEQAKNKWCPHANSRAIIGGEQNFNICHAATKAQVKS